MYEWVVMLFNMESADTTPKDNEFDITLYDQLQYEGLY